MIVPIESEKVFSVIPEKAGIQENKKLWTPAFPRSVAELLRRTGAG
jgi:hypothetical protein